MVINHNLFQLSRAVDFSRNPFYEPNFKFYDHSLTDALEAGDRDCEAFFRLLALCHTVMPEEKKGKHRAECHVIVDI